MNGERRGHPRWSQGGVPLTTPAGTNHAVKVTIGGVRRNGVLEGAAAIEIIAIGESHSMPTTNTATTVETTAAAMARIRLGWIEFFYARRPSTTLAIPCVLIYKNYHDDLIRGVGDHKLRSQDSSLIKSFTKEGSLDRHPSFDSQE